MYIKLDGFILGLSNGITCMATCAPVLIPYLLGEGKSITRNYWITGQFLLGRLLGYLLFAFLAWTVNTAVIRGPNLRNLLVGGAYVLFAALLIFYGFFKKENSDCQSPCHRKVHQHLTVLWPALFPAAAGFVTGLNFCPPILLAFASAAAQSSLIMSLFYFFSFFLGTAALFILLPLIGISNRFTVMQIIGKMAAGIIGLYYLYSGGIMLLGGIAEQ